MNTAACKTGPGPVAPLNIEAARGSGAEPAAPGAASRDALLEELTRMYSVADSLRTLVSHLAQFGAATSRRELVDRILDAILDVSGTQRAIFFTVTRGHIAGEAVLEQYATRTSPGAAPSCQARGVSNSRLLRAVDGRESIVEQDVLRAGPQTDSTTTHRLRTVVCVPVTTAPASADGGRDVPAVVYADSDRPGRGPAHDSAAMVSFLARTGAQFLAQWQRHDLTSAAPARSRDVDMARGMCDVLAPPDTGPDELHRILGRLDSLRNASICGDVLPPIEEGSGHA